MINAMDMRGAGVSREQLIRMFLTDELPLSGLAQEKLEQLAHLPDLVGIAVLPDVHAKPDNPFPTGTVVASQRRLYPSAIGQDIGCGMAVWHGRVKGNGLSMDQVRAIFHRMVEGVADGKPKRRQVAPQALERMLCTGAKWAVEEGLLREEECVRIERRGQFVSPEEAPRVRHAIPSDAWEGGLTRVRSIGGGNHFLELQYVEQILDSAAAEGASVREGDLILWIHTGSGSLGKRLENYYTRFWDATDRGRRWRQRWRRLRHHMPHARVHRWRECWALIDGVGATEGLDAMSPQGQRYLAAHRAALNLAVVNRLLLAQVAKEALEASGIQHQFSLLVDVAHESIQQERVQGTELWVHRNGASRAVPPRSWNDPWGQGLGQWLPLPGSLGRPSYLAMTLPGVEQSFWAVNHGAGRVIEKPDAWRLLSEDEVRPFREWQGHRLFYAGSGDDLIEQIPSAFKDITAVGRAVEAHGLAKLVARCQPIASLKS